MPVAYFRRLGSTAALLCTAALLLAALAAGAHAQTDGAHGNRSPHAAAPPNGYTPHRVYDVAAGSFIDFEAFAARAAAADVVFFGERHGHAPGHRLQHALLQALARRGDATISMEMFERDVAHVVAGYVTGAVDHATFAAEARPWPRFFSDYHALIEEARANGWHVIAANAPRELAALVAREGAEALDDLEPARRAHIAADVSCPADAYRQRFLDEMNRHPTGDHGAADEEELRNQRYYESQCLKDETMAEAIAEALRADTARPIVHFTGAFHSDHGDGIPVRVRRRAGAVDAITLTVVPVPDLDHADPAPHAARADYLLFTLSDRGSPHQP